MRLVCSVLVAVVLLVAALSSPRGAAYAQAGPSFDGMMQQQLDDLLRRDPEAVIRQLESARRTIGASATAQQRAQMGGVLLFAYGIAANVAKDADLSELDKRAADVFDWIMNGPGEAQTANAGALYLEYFLNSGRPGLMLQRGEQMRQDPRIGGDFQAVMSLYVARAYHAMGQIEEANVALEDGRARIAGLSDEDGEFQLLNYLTIGFPIWADLADSAKMRWAWPYAQILIQKDEYQDLLLLQLAAAARKAALVLGQRDIAQSASLASAEFMRRLFNEGRDQLERECIAMITAMPDTLAGEANFPARYERCRADFPEGMSLPIEFLLTGAEVFELRGDRLRAAALYGEAIGMGERVRSSFDPTQRQAFYEGSQRRLYQGMVRNLSLAAFAAPSDEDRYFEALAAADAMRARQYSDLRGASGAVTAQSLKAFAASLPDGVLVTAITTLDDMRVAFTFDRTQRRFGIVTNLNKDTKDQQEQRLRGFLVDPNSDDASRERATIHFTAHLLGDGRRILANANKLIVLIDGSPALIPATVWSTRDDVYTPLGAAAEVQYATSLRDVLAPKAPPSRGRGVFALGDPEFPAIPDALGLSQDQTNSINGRTSGAQSWGASRILPRLANTEFEALDVARGFDGAARTLFKRDASEYAVKNGNLSGFRFLHFATHGLLAGDFAGLGEPALALAAGNGEDGFLRASEVQMLKLDADLTVLSACNTGSGRVVAGEGAIGLSRAFLLAGSRAVLASLWPVNDATTEAFMAGFYDRLRSGEAPAQALMQTTNALRADKRHPKFWAPFILVSQ